MKKLAVIALLVLFVFASAFAEAKPVVKASSGTVVSATSTKLVVKVGTKEETFLIDTKTVVTGKDKKPLVVTTLKAGDKVRVRFTRDAKMVMTAVSIVKR